MMLKQWLESLGMRNVENCTVLLTNGKQKEHHMIGCIYNNPKLDNKVYIYCLGDYDNLPLKSTSRTAVFYHDEFQDYHFIVAAYANDTCLEEPYKVYHPLGKNVLLALVEDSFVKFSQRHERTLIGKIVIK